MTDFVPWYTEKSGLEIYIFLIPTFQCTMVQNLSSWARFSLHEGLQFSLDLLSLDSLKFEIVLTRSNIHVLGYFGARS